MVRLAAAALLIGAAAFLSAPAPGGGILQLPAGVVEVRSEMAIDSLTEVRGARSGTVLRAAPGFAGRAVMVVLGNGVRLRDFTIDGNRDALEVRAGLPPYDTPFARFTGGNGVLAEGVAGVSIQNVRFRNMAGFAVLVSRSRDVAIDRVSVASSGSRNAAGRNNSTGGILLEEGTADFRVTRCELRDIRGNGVWTHSLYTSPRNARGLFALNRFQNIGRDAIQVGHATDIRVEENSGGRIGFPLEDVDIKGGAIPVAIDTAGNVDRSSYARNRFAGVNGKCIDLDGFHDGEVIGNVCVDLGNFGIVMNNSNPDMRSQNIRVAGNVIDGARFGGVFVIGAGHVIARNRLLNLNRVQCDTDVLRNGIYLGKGAERPAPARGNVIEENEITGFKMDTRCIAAAPAILAEWNTVRGNRCSAAR